MYLAPQNERATLARGQRFDFSPAQAAAISRVVESSTILIAAPQTATPQNRLAGKLLRFPALITALLANKKKAEYQLIISDRVGG